MSETLIRLSRAHWPVTVLGPGRRLGFWLQGCSIGCAGCLARDTWNPAGGTALTIEALVRWAREVSGGRPDGVTISGGEPFDQPEALAAFLAALARWRDSDGLDFDILAYSGHPYAQLRERHPQALALLDVLIPEPFVSRAPPGGRWRGSANQPLLTLSPRGRQRYAGVDLAAPPGRGEIQLAVQDGQIWYIGVPARGDLARVARITRAAGLLQQGVSWS
jgi:anaerobic ribonucleoside-triphosphate reductase activating protein